MNKFKDGDLVVVRSDLTADEKMEWPHFVLGMEPCSGHIYQVVGPYGFDLELCDEDPSAPDPTGWSWNELWCEPAFLMEDAEDVDMTMVFDLV